MPRSAVVTKYEFKKNGNCYIIGLLRGGGSKGEGVP